jgi:CRISPR-associated protein Cst1
VTLATLGADWTGHPIIDVGLAAICAMSGVHEPAELTADSVEVAVAELEEAYFSGAMGAYLTCLYPNAAPVNPNVGEQKRQLYASEILRAYRLPSGDGALACGICGRPSVVGANRQHVPLLMAEASYNFRPAGQGSLPVCGLCMSAAQAFAFGAVRCQGKALAVHSDDPSVTLVFAQEAVEWNRRELVAAKAAQTKYGSVPDPYYHVVETIGKAADEMGDMRASATVYHLTNSGQGPDIRLYHVPSQLLRFLRQVWLDTYREIWSALVRLGHEQSRPERNGVYEDVFRLPANASSFVHRWLRRLAAQHRRAWSITRLFLEEVIGLEKERIDAIRELGDRVADEIAATNDHRLYGRIFRSSGYQELRNQLIKLDQRAAYSGRAVPTGFDRFVVAFEAADGVASGDWRLARDLVLIRMIERLAEKGFFTLADAELAEEAETAEDTVEGLAEGREMR